MGAVGLLRHVGKFLTSLSGRGHKYDGIRWRMHPVPAALLGARIRRVFSLLAPCGTGASAISVRHRIYAHDHLGPVGIVEVCAMASTIRAFVAFDLPSDIIDHVVRLQSALRARGLRLRWVRPQNLHLTLKFLGDILQADAGTVGQAIQRSGQGMEPLEMTIQGMGVFPGIKRPRVLWIGLGGQIELLRQLYARIEAELSDLGFDREKRGFTAHLTIARFKEAVAPQDLLQAFQELGVYEPRAFLADRLILYKSDLRPQGAIYTPLAEVRLNRSQA